MPPARPKSPRRGTRDDRYFRGETGWRLMAPAELAAHRAECDRLAGCVVVLALALARQPTGDESKPA